MAEKWGEKLFGEVADSFLAEDLDASSPRIELYGDKRVLIENHHGILEYDDTCMRIACDKLEICITGANLTLKALSLTELAVTGKIHSLEYKT